MSLAAVLLFFQKLAELGATPAIQQAALQFFSEHMGVDQKVLDAAIKAQKDAPAPRLA